MLKKKLRRIPVFVFTLAGMLLLGATAAFAATSTGTPFVDNINSLISTASGWMAGISAGGGGLMMGYHAVMRNLNDDPQAVAHHTGSMKKVLVGTAIACGATGIVSLVSGAFGGPAAATTSMLLLHATRFFC